MSADNWQKCCAVTLDYEGGNDDDVHDPGGRTSRGITQREYNVWRQTHPGLAADVWHAPQATIVDIYKQEYWDKSSGDAWPVGVDLVVYDAGVNSGLGKGIAWARRALAQTGGTFESLALAARAARDRVEIIQRYQAARLSFLHALRTWAYFGRGWAARVAGVEAIATRMAQESLGRPATPVLEVRADVAGKLSKGAGASISAPAGVSAAHVATAAHNTALDYVITAGVLLACLVVVAYLAHTWYVHRVRARAFSAEAVK